MCGGDVRVITGLRIAECEYCGCRQSVPRDKDEKRLASFNRANEARRNNEFDKASGIYESIIAEYPEEAEAFWGLCLCTFGIEYVDDPATMKKIPTCHRTQLGSIFDDTNYKNALNYGDFDQKTVFAKEAREIDQIQKSILSVVKLEKPYDVFICYKESDSNNSRTKESVIGQEIYDALTEKGLNVFFARISLEDKIGSEYEPLIFAALNSARVMLVLGSSADNFNAVWVRNEWSRFIGLMKQDKKKVLIPCYCDMNAYDMPSEFSNLQAQDLGKIGAIQDIIRGIIKVTGVKEQVSVNSIPSIKNNNQIDILYKRAQIAIENREWKKADELSEKIIEMQPENGDAYRIKLLASVKAESLKNIYQYNGKLSELKYYKLLMKYGTADDKETLRKQALLSMNIHEQKKRKALVIIGIICVTAILVIATIIAVPYIEYALGNKYIKAEDYDKGYEWLTKSDRPNAVDVIKESKYNRAVQLIKDMNYDEAVGLFTEVGDYLDGRTRNKEIELLDLKVGDYIKFGKYEQDGDSSNGTEPIEWRVMARSEGALLLLSKNIILPAPKVCNNIMDYQRMSMELLQNDIYKNAFDEEEKSMVIKIDNPSIEYDGVSYVFMLTEDAVNKLFASDEDRIASITKYVKDNGVTINTKGGGSWGIYKVLNDEPKAEEKRQLKMVYPSGGISESDVHITRYTGIRPAIWISPNKVNLDGKISIEFINTVLEQQ